MQSFLDAPLEQSEHRSHDDCWPDHLQRIFAPAAGDSAAAAAATAAGAEEAAGERVFGSPVLDYAITHNKTRLTLVVHDLQRACLVITNAHSVLYSCEANKADAVRHFLEVPRLAVATFKKFPEYHAPGVVPAARGCRIVLFFAVIAAVS